MSYPKMSAPRKLIYIMGCAHCGSTLLTRILARHPEIATVGELKMNSIPNQGDFRCGCGTQILECSFWKQVASALAPDESKLDFGDFGTHFGNTGGVTGKIVGTQVRGAFLEKLRKLAFVFWPGAASALSRVSKRNKQVIDAVCEVLRKPVFLDDSKDPTRLMHLHRSGLYDIKAIYLVRDGRAIVASYKKRVADMCANFNLWKNKLGECENLKRLHPEIDILEVRYEDLCQNPEAVIRNILDFAGLADELEHCLDLGGKGRHHIVGHSSRLQANSSIELRTEWPEILTPEDLESFERHGAQLNALYGYQ